MHGAPIRVAVQGNVAALQATATVAIVGSRAASTSSMKAAGALAEALAGLGITVVSGGALGIDGAAHRGALGHTVVVLGSGITHWYPARHVDLFNQIVTAGGAVISTFQDDASPVRSYFVSRNRLIAALADVVVVVEAQLRSGSLSTARYGRELGRRVLAMPGSPGCDSLLASGAAHVAESVDDVVAALAGNVRALAVPELPDEQCVRVVAALNDEPCDESALAHRAGLSLSQALRALAQLDGTPHVVMLPGRRFIRPTSFSSAT